MCEIMVAPIVLSHCSHAPELKYSLDVYSTHWKKIRLYAFHFVRNETTNVDKNATNFVLLF